MAIEFNEQIVELEEHRPLSAQQETRTSTRTTMEVE